MASILAVDQIRGTSHPGFVALPEGIADGTTIVLRTIANRAVLSLVEGGIQLSHLSGPVLQQVTANSSVALPGTVIQKVGTSMPPGTLACNGQAVSRSVYANLFAEIGTSHGNGDGETTFNVPNFGGNWYVRYVIPLLFSFLPFLLFVNQA